MATKSLISLVLAIAVSSCGGYSATPSLVVIGDSITLRTGLCLATDTLSTCLSSGRPAPANSFATYLPNVIANLGRGGDTCTTQAAFASGPFNGQFRGMLARLDEAIELNPTRISVLIGVNDINSWAVSQTDVISCITMVWDRISSVGIEPIAMTYGLMPAMKGVVELNASIRMEAARRHLTVVDFETIVPYITVDDIHPDVATAKIEAQLWLRVLK